MESKYKIGWIAAILLLIIVLAYGSITGFAWSASPSASPTGGGKPTPQPWYQPPTVSAITPTTATQNQQATFKTNVTDKYGVISCDFNWDGSLVGAMALISGNNKNGFWARNYTPTIAGVHNANATCKNNKKAIGYGPNTNITVNAQNDTQPPTVNMIYPHFATQNQPQTYSATAYDNIGVVSCNFFWDNADKGAMTPHSDNWTKVYTEGVSGLHQARAECKDAANNKGVGQTRNISVYPAPPNDTQAPIVSSVWPTLIQVANNTTSVAFRANASDYVQVKTCRFQWQSDPYVSMYLWSGNYQSGTWGVYYTVPGMPGTYQANASCYDTSNNLGYGPITTITITT